MKTIRVEVGITLDNDAVGSLVDAIQHVIEKAIASGTGRALDAVKDRAKTEEPSTKSEAPPPATCSTPTPTRPKQPEDMPLLVDSKQVAKLLNLGERTIWRMAHSGILPKPMKIGGAVRWSYEEVKAWIEAGCPRDQKWKRLRK